MKTLLIYILCTISLIISSCSIHQIDIQQGNVITPEAITQIKPGMDKKQVIFILGAPLVTDAFHHNRWDYIYLFQPRMGVQERSHITLFFEDDKLIRIEGDQPVTPGDHP